jgi:hypothetical protein
MAFAFEKLIVYQKAMDFSDRICEITQTFPRFFGIARGSVRECVSLLELAKRRGLIQPGNHLKLKADLEEIARMLSGLINGLDKRQS